MIHKISELLDYLETFSEEQLQTYLNEGKYPSMKIFEVRSAVLDLFSSYYQHLSQSQQSRLDSKQQNTSQEQEIIPKRQSQGADELVPLVYRSLPVKNSDYWNLTSRKFRLIKEILGQQCLAEQVVEYNLTTLDAIFTDSAQQKQNAESPIIINCKPLFLQQETNILNRVRATVEKFKTQALEFQNNYLSVWLDELSQILNKTYRFRNSDCTFSPKTYLHFLNQMIETKVLRLINPEHQSLSDSIKKITDEFICDYREIIDKYNKIYDDRRFSGCSINQSKFQIYTISEISEKITPYFFVRLVDIVSYTESHLSLSNNLPQNLKKKIMAIAGKEFEQDTDTNQYQLCSSLIHHVQTTIMREQKNHQHSSSSTIVLRYVGAIVASFIFSVIFPLAILKYFHADRRVRTWRNAFFSPHSGSLFALHQTKRAIEQLMPTCKQKVENRTPSPSSTQPSSIMLTSTQ